jgi:hypothetical protein
MFFHLQSKVEGRGMISLITQYWRNFKTNMSLQILNALAKLFLYKMKNKKL